MERAEQGTGGLQQVQEEHVLLGLPRACAASVRAKDVLVRSIWVAWLTRDLFMQEDP